MKYCPLCRSELRDRILDGIARPACSSSNCVFIHWNNPIPVVAGLVQWDGNYVLARNAAWPEGMFSMLTGFLEKSESPEAAVVREVQEELGLRAERPTFIGHFPLPELNQLIIAYGIEARGALRLSQEIAEVRVLSPSDFGAFDFGPLRLTRDIATRWLRTAGRKE